MPICEIYCNGCRVIIPDITTNTMTSTTPSPTERDQQHQGLLLGDGDSSPNPSPISIHHVDSLQTALIRPRTPSPLLARRSPSPNYAYNRRTPSPYRRSQSPLPPGYGSRRGSLTYPATGYEQYQMSLLEVPWTNDYGDASSDDLSSEWDSDVPDAPVSTSKVCFNYSLGLV